MASWHTTWARWRQAIARRVLQVLPSASGGIAAALMTGDRGAIPAEVISAMRDSGLAHLLAISGLHMGLIAGWLFFGLIPTCRDADSIGLARPRCDLIQDGELKEVRHDQWSCGPASR
jgi:hypothetical protein